MNFIKIVSLLANAALVLGEATASDTLLLNHCGLIEDGQKYMKDSSGGFYVMEKANQIFCNIWLMNATGGGILDPADYAPLTGEKSTWTCEKAKTLALSQLQHDCGIGGESPGPAPPSPSPSPSPSGSWSWATISSDPTDDFTNQRFCGTDLKGNNDVGSYRAGASIPWGIICKKYGGKWSLYNFMCPKCPTTGEGCVGGYTDHTQRTWLKNKNTGTLNSYESIMAIDDGIYENGMCWELQPLKFKDSFDQFNPMEYDSIEGIYGGGAKTVNDDSIVLDGWDVSKSVIVKMAVGCGGNCTNGDPWTGQTVTESVDCINSCIGGATGLDPIYPDPCDVRAATTDFCKYLIKMNTMGWTNFTYDDMVGTNSAPPLYDAQGNYTETGNGHRNWCSGTHMHFDLTNENTKMHQIVGSNLKNFLVRYRPVKCPAEGE